MLQKITATLASSLHVSRVVTSRLPGANLAAMPLHWSMVQAICERDEQAAEEAMRKLVILATDVIHRALGHHPHSEGEPQDGSW
jgi:DNA-binding FadR family transcriptional regulator